MAIYRGPAEEPTLWYGRAAAICKAVERCLRSCTCRSWALVAKYSLELFKGSPRSR